METKRLRGLVGKASPESRDRGEAAGFSSGIPPKPLHAEQPSLGCPLKAEMQASEPENCPVPAILLPRRERGAQEEVATWQPPWETPRTESGESQLLGLNWAREPAGNMKITGVSPLLQRFPHLP